MAKPKALITGITGMDGSYLAELLLAKGYEVHGVVRRASTFNRERIDHLLNDSSIKGKTLFLHYGDLTDGTNMSGIVQDVKPVELYNLAAQSHVHISFQVPEYSADTDGIGTVRLLEAIKRNCPKCKYYQASTSELFGRVMETPQNETTPFRPQSPYAAAKLYAYWVTRCYRDAYNLFASNGILFNHEGPRRGENFVTRKITLSAARIKCGQQDCLYLGNLDAMRDWGDSEDYVRSMWLMLQNEYPDDFVVATGETHSVKEFCEQAFKCAGLPLVFEGTGLNCKGIDQEGNVRVRVNPEYFRPLEVDLLLGDASKAKKVLGWEPQIKFDQLVEKMVRADMDLVRKQML